MERFRNILYVIGAIVVIIRLFFRDDMSEKLRNVSYVLVCVCLALVVVFEIIMWKKNKKK